MIAVMLAATFSAVAVHIGGRRPLRPHPSRPPDIGTPRLIRRRLCAGPQRFLRELAGAPRLRTAVLAALAAVGALAVLSGPLAALGVGAVAAAVVHIVLARQREQRREQRDQAWREALSRIAGALRVGAAMPEALRSAADAAGPGSAGLLRPAAPQSATRRWVRALRGRGIPPASDARLAPRLRAAAAYLDIGGLPAAALGLLAGRDDYPRAGRLGATLELCHTLGLAPAALLTELAADEDDRARTRRDLRASLATVRATGQLLGALPFGGALLAAALGASAPALLFATFGGQLCLVAAGALEAAGLVWVEQLARPMP